MFKGMMILGMFLCLVRPAGAAIIYVPDDYPTIQGAIDAAVNGDTVIVRPGRYVENIDFMGKAIIVQSEQGAANTVIDGNQVGRVVRFGSRENDNSVLDGFTIRNGYESYGGGISCSSSSPTVINNIIMDNSAVYGGGGIYSEGSSLTPASPTIANNVISGNTAQYAGGIHCDYRSFHTMITFSVLERPLIRAGLVRFWARTYYFSGTPRLRDVLLKKSRKEAAR
jgi:predicted outer membrane repeat protein